MSEIELLNMSGIFVDEEDLADTYYIDDAEDALVGITDDNQLVYSYRKLIDVYMKKYGNTYEEAADDINYNLLRSLPYVGEKAPIIIWEIERGTDGVKD